MAYSKQNFQNGQILNAANLEKMENGIIAGQGAHNLLDNSDFRNPVNSRGVYDTTESENLRETIDRWISYLTSIDINQTGMLLSGQFGSGYNTIYQVVPLTPDGRIYTAALYYADGTVKCASGDFLTRAGGVGAEYGVLLEKNSDGKPYVQLYTYDGKRIIGAALYEGSYTADTLPSYVPKGKRVEMLNCGVSLAPHNILDNSDFSNPVNLRGFSSTTSTGEIMGIDRWLFSVNSGGNISLTADGLVCQNANLIQRIESKLLDSSKEYTQVFWRADGTPIFPTKWIDFSYPSYGPGVGRVVYYGITGTVVAAALYEGAYDANTLPPYVLKGKHVEMLNCGISLAPHNLLDNSNFRNPVAQAGIGGSHGSTKYVCDRWYDTYVSGEYSLNEGVGITLSYGTNHCYCVQKINNASQYYGKTMTLAIQLSNGTIYVNSGTYLSSSISLKISGDNWEYDLFYDRVELVVISDSITVSWIALYEGSYDASTLPAYQPKEYAAELVECQRYYRSMPYPVIPCGNNPAGTQVYGFLPFRMRIDNPTVSCDALYYFKGDSTFVSVSNASASSYGAGTRIVFNLSQSVAGNLAGAIAGNGITLSADL